jgi:hypothetical protein
LGEDGREAIEVVRGIVKMPAILRIDEDKPFLGKKSFTNNLSFKRKLDQRILTDEFCFSFSTGFLFWKKEKVLGCMRFIRGIIRIFRGI